MARGRLILGMTLVVLAGGIVVFAAQQPLHPRLVQHQVLATHAPALAGHHEGCAAGDATSTADKSHVPAHLAQALELTTAQVAEIDRMSAEICQAMAKAHDAMMKVLTPEQRARIAELHGGDHSATGLHAFMKKLHGGGK